MKKLLVILCIGCFLLLSIRNCNAVYANQSLGGICDIKDQFQETSDECRWFGPYAWQEFKPRGAIQIRFEVKIKKGYEDSPPLKLTLEQPLGNVLVALELNAADIPDVCDWVKFDITDTNLDTTSTAFINLSFGVGGEYAWCGANGDPYPKGTSSEGSQWDWCFRTYVDKSTPTPFETSSLQNIQITNPVSGNLYIFPFGESRLLRLNLLRPIMFGSVLSQFQTRVWQLLIS